MATGRSFWIPKGKASGRDVAIKREAHGREVGIAHVWDRDAVQDGGYRYVADEVGLPLPRLSDHVTPNYRGCADDVGGLVRYAEERCRQTPDSSNQRGEDERRPPAGPRGRSQSVKK